MNDFSPHGRGILGSDQRSVTGILGQTFLTPPYSILNAHTAWWIARKNAWLKLGIVPNAGRADLDDLSGSAAVNGLTYGMNPDAYLQDKPSAKERDKIRTRKDRDGILPAGVRPAKLVNAGTSYFDPVLCELMIRWFCPKDGNVLDPFCGGPTLAIISVMLGREFQGIELRKEQVDATKEQCRRTLETQANRITIRWDSALQGLPSLVPVFDFVFTSPPYFDLERYSDEGADLSNANSYGDYLNDMEEVGRQLYRVLRRNRFCALLLGDVRDKMGFARGLPGNVCRRFRRAGFKLYNEIIYYGSKAGSMRLRVSRQFDKSRKIGRIHQTVYIFIKGNPVKATNAVKGER